MRRSLLAVPFLVASPSFAEVTHSIETRFGVGYTSDPNQRHGQMQSLYSGRYTSAFSHQSDGGVLFRFELGIEVGNFEPRRPGRLDSQSGEVFVETD